MPPAALIAQRRQQSRQPVRSVSLLREALPVELHTLREAKVVDEAKRAVEVVLLSVGKGNPRDRHYYTQQAIESGAAAFEGKPAFADHASTTEEASRPERSVRDIVGYYEQLHAEGPALKGVLRILPGPAYDWAWALVTESIAYAEKFPGQNLAGISINARGETEPVVIEGENWKNVTQILEAKSADIVTLPARGGRFIQLTEDEGGSMKLGEILQAAKAKAAEIEAAAGDKVPMVKDLGRMLDQAATMAGQGGEEGQLIHLPDYDDMPIMQADGMDGDDDAAKAKKAEYEEAFKRQALKLAAKRYNEAAEACKSASEAEADETKKAEAVKQAEGFRAMADRYAQAAEPPTAPPPAEPEKKDAPPAAPAVPAGQVESLRQELDAAKADLAKVKDESESRTMLREANIPPMVADLMVTAMVGKTADEKKAFVETKRRELGSGLLETIRRGGFHNGPRTPAGDGAGSGATLLRGAGLIK